MQKRLLVNRKIELSIEVFLQLAKTEKLFVSHLFRDTNSFSSLAKMWIRSKIERAIASMFQFWRLKPRAAPWKLCFSFAI